MVDAPGFFLKTKESYCEHYRKEPLLTVFITLMSIALISSIIISLAVPSYLMSILGKMSQHVFMDHFWSVQDSMNHPYTELHVIYPPLAVCFYAAIGHLTMPFVDHSTGDIYIDMYNSQIPMMVFALFMCISIFLLMSTLKRPLIETFGGRKSTLFVFLGLLSFPVIIAVQNGNSIICMVFLTVLFLLGYNSEKKIIRYLAYLCLGIVAGFKIMPAILALLIIREKRYKEFVACAAIIAALVFVPIIFTDGTIQLLIHNILTIPDDLGGSVNNIFKIFVQMSDMLGIAQIRTVGTIVLITVTALTLIVLAFDRHMPLWKTVALAGCFFVLGPGVGTPYLYLYLLPAAMFMLICEKEPTRYNLACITLIQIPLMLFSMDLIVLKVIATVILLSLFLYEGLRDIYRDLRKNSNSKSSAEQPIIPS